MPRFFSDVSLEALLPGQEICLPDAVFHHAIRVRRLKNGDACTLFDGLHGTAWRVLLTRIDKRQAYARIEHRLPPSPPPRFSMTLALAVTAAERMDWALQKGTELGAAAFLPFYSEYSNARVDAARQERRAEHWRAILASACEQCGQYRLPRLLPLVDFGAALNANANIDAAPLCLILDATADRSLSTRLHEIQTQAAPPSAAILMIGPEGGFTESEIRTAMAAGWQPVHLGPRILRAETAAVTAATLMQAALGDLA